MAYQIQDLDPVRELSPLRRRIEFGVVFVCTFLLVRFGGWHHNMDPLGYPVYPSTVTALAVAGIASCVFTLWRIWYATHSAAPLERRARPRD
jgi:hypothetical protein